MHSDTSLSPGSHGNDQTETVMSQTNAASFFGRRPSALIGYRKELTGDVRAIVQRRLLWMSRAHDRIRAKLLARHAK